MIIGVDFDGVVVEQDRPYSDVTTPLRLRPGSEIGLRALRAAGHILLLFSARANRALRMDPQLDPLVRAGVRRVNLAAWKAAQPLQEARYQQMVGFAAQALPGVFAAVDDGLQGKPCCDLWLDDRAVNVGDAGLGWAEIAARYGAEQVAEPPAA